MARRITLTPPPELSAEALAEWGRITDELKRAKLLDVTDRAVLILYCETWADYKQAALSCKRDGTTIVYSNGNAGATAQYKIKHQKTKQLAELLALLGLTPTQRIKREAKEKTKKTKDVRRLGAY